MSLNQVLSLLSVVIDDGLSFFGQAGGAALGQVFQGVQNRRLSKAREILIDEIRRGDRQLSETGEIDEVAAILYRYARAAVEGTARLNLRLMASAIAGQASVGQLIADEFLSYADIIASLRREEIILLATFLRHAEALGVTTGPIEDRDNKAFDLATAELVPAPFPTDDDFAASVTAILRTGLITYRSGFGGSFHKPSPLLYRIARLIDFEAAIIKEPVPHHKR